MQKQFQSYETSMALSMALLSARNKRDAQKPEALRSFFKGLKDYRKYKSYDVREPLKGLWFLGEMSVGFKKAETRNSKGAVLFVPSLINTNHILDLCDTRSLIRWLSEKGYDVYCIDWGRNTKDDAQHNNAGIILKRLTPAIKYVRDHAGRKIHLCGYCMGGTLMAGALAFIQDDIKSAVFFATPWDFHATVFSNMVRQHRFEKTQNQTVPGYVLQSLFYAMDPDCVLKKYASFADMKDDPERQKIFMAVEGWINTPKDISTALLEDCMQDWFIENAPLKNTWCLGACSGEQNIDLSDINIPCLIVSGKKDRLVPKESSLPLADQIKHSEILLHDSGHIGFIAGRHAKEKVWERLHNWLSA